MPNLVKWLPTGRERETMHTPRARKRGLKSSYLVTRIRGERQKAADSGAYQLILRLERPEIIVVGALGTYTFSPGTYIYTGRASRYLSKRIERHLQAEKRLRWHIDYLLKQAQIEGIRVYPDKAEQECSINNDTARSLRGIFPVPGFGSSDCRCISHLVLMPEAGTRNLEAEIEKCDPSDSKKIPDQKIPLYRK
jgi:Uri superfamily endonuclease